MLRRALKIIPIAVIVIAGILFINGKLTRRYSEQVKSFQDMNALSLFFADYAASHSDLLPTSWNQLVADGYVKPHHVCGAKFSGYPQTEIGIWHPERFRWSQEADLKQYYVTDHGVFNRTTSQPARLIWLEGIDPKISNEDMFNRYLISGWQSCRSSASQPAL